MPDVRAGNRDYSPIMVALEIVNGSGYVYI